MILSHIRVFHILSLSHIRVRSGISVRVSICLLLSSESPVQVAFRVAYPSRLSESPFRVAFPSRLSELPIRDTDSSILSDSHILVSFPSQLSESLSESPSESPCESPSESLFTYPSRPSESYILVSFRVAHPSRLPSRLSESLFRVAYPNLLSESSPPPV